jgi:hypothetical protein
MSDAGNDNPPQSRLDGVKTGLMALLTLVFVALYVGALFGWISSKTSDPVTVSRLESIIFVIIGYYFGRLPSQANEATLKNEINRQAGKTDQAERVKDVAQQDKAALQQKVQSATVILSPSVQDSMVSATGVGGIPPELQDPKVATAAALRVLTS